jgi:hypothetical protein
MDKDAMNVIILLLTVLSYVGVFALGYAMRSYLLSHERRRPYQ